jgi:hypothetical protein
MISRRRPGRASRADEAWPAAPSGSRPRLRGSRADVLRQYGTEHDVAGDDVTFADGDQTCDLVVLASEP